MLTSILNSIARAIKETSVYRFFKTLLSRKIIYQAQKEGVSFWVYEESGYRYLSFVQPGRETQTCLDLKKPTRVVFEYQKLMIACLLTRPSPKRICIIGLGGGSLATALRRLYPEVIIDNVELNAHVVECAERFFSFKQDKQMRVHLTDGVQYLKTLSSDNLYDAIIIDAFDALYIPKEFLTESFVQSVYTQLQPQGIALMNTFKDSSTYKLETHLYQHVFGQVYQPTFPFSLNGNRVIFVSKSSLPAFKSIKQRVYQAQHQLRLLGLIPDKLLSVIVKLSSY
jgi:spermidine synthase